jgi:hypothetical protein
MEHGSRIRMRESRERRDALMGCILGNQGRREGEHPRADGEVELRGLDAKLEGDGVDKSWQGCGFWVVRTPLARRQAKKSPSVGGASRRGTAMDSPMKCRYALPRSWLPELNSPSKTVSQLIRSIPW